MLLFPRYRKQIGGEHISVLADIKKKHSAHAVTADVNIGETAAAADFFRAGKYTVPSVSLVTSVYPRYLHSANAVTADVNIGDTAAAADIFRAGEYTVPSVSLVTSMYGTYTQPTPSRPPGPLCSQGHLSDPPVTSVFFGA